MAAAIVLALTTGCGFMRAVVNPDVREIDTAWIEPGRTTRADVVARIGLPPTVREMGGIGKNSFRWTSVDTFTGKLEVGYIVTPTFERGVESYSEDILILFDEADKVELVSRTRKNSDGRPNLIEWREASK